MLLSTLHDVAPPRDPNWSELQFRDCRLLCRPSIWSPRLLGRSWDSSNLVVLVAGRAVRPSCWASAFPGFPVYGLGLVLPYEGRARPGCAFFFRFWVQFSFGFRGFSAEALSARLSGFAVRYPVTFDSTSLAGIFCYLLN